MKCKWIKCSNQTHRLAQWIQKEDPHVWWLQEIHFRSRDRCRFKVRGWKKVFIPRKWKWKKAGIAIFILDKTDFKIKTVTRDNIKIKGSIHKEDVTIINIHVPNIRTPWYLRQTLTAIKKEIDSNIIIMRDFNTPLSLRDTWSRQKSNKETQALK